MSQYYISPRTQRASSTAHEDISHVGTDGSHWSQPGHSIYIFPNPPSAPPSPASPALSVPTDISLSLSEIRSRESSVLPSVGPSRDSGCKTSYTTNSNDEDVEKRWEWVYSPTDEAETLSPGVGEEPERIDRWEFLARQRARKSTALHEYRSRSSCRATLQKRPSGSSSAELGREQRLQIPLLSFFVSFLSIDDTTLHLLSHSSSRSALFPGHPQLFDEHGADEPDGEIRGLVKLLSSPSETRTLKDGCAVASDPSFAPSNPFLASPFTGLWDLLSGFVTDSGKAVREVLSK